MSLTAVAFLCMYASGLLLALVRGPLWGLLTYFLAFYAHPPGRWWGADLPGIRWSLIAAIATLVTAWLRPRKAAGPPWHGNWAAKLLILFAAWMWIQSAWALDTSSHLDGCVLFTKYVILFYLIYRIADGVPRLEVLALAQVSGGFLLGWSAFRENVSGRLEGVGGPGIDDANTLGMQLTVCLVFGGFLLLRLRGTRRLFVFGAIPFIMNAVILTGSRGAAIGAAAAGCVALLLAPATLRWRVRLSACLAVILLVVLAHDLFWQRLGTISLEATEASAASRIELLRCGYRMFRDHPLGGGHRGHEVLSPQYVPADYLTGGRRSAHNTFMAVLVEQGAPGGGLWLLLQAWLAITVLRVGRRARQNHQLQTYRAVLGASLAAVFVSGQFSNFLKAEVWVWLTAMLVALQAIGRRTGGDEGNGTTGVAVAQMPARDSEARA